jgi:signal transduction histidine kinase/CheY-like chemotaxis protein
MGVTVKRPPARDAGDISHDGTPSSTAVALLAATGRPSGGDRDAALRAAESERDELRAERDALADEARQLRAAIDILPLRVEAAEEEAHREESRREDTFIATLGHELRNPLTPIRAGFELLRREGTTPAQRRATAEIVDRQLRHLAGLVDELLDVARVTRGRIELHRRPLDLAQVVREAIADHRPLFQRGGIALEERLPAGAVPFTGDPLRLAQALGNVLQNASKFTPPGGHVSVVLEVTDRRAEIRVRDDGDGIAPETLERLFEPFEQGEPPGRADGLGLGLSLARGLAELHGGALTARSEGPGMGAEFRLVLPLGSRVPEVPATAKAPAPHRSTRPEVRRVLLVEDNEDAGDLLRELLALHGHDVSLARDAEAALALARALRPEVVVSDLGLPGVMDGYALARTLRAEFGPALRIVALSGFAAPDDVIASQSAGFDAHFSKPLELERLRAVLEG